MTAPVVNQIRRQVILSNGQAKFEVTSTITNSGDLPFPELFVATITDPLNPKSDSLARIATPRDLLTDADILYIKVDSADIRVIAGDPFARVANVSDITALPRDRTAAVQGGFTEFLTTTVTLLYDTLPTADAAYKTIIDRLSQLVTSYRTFMSTFGTHPSQNYNLPQPGISVESELTATYKAKKTDTKAAREARDAAARAYETCLQQGEADRAILTFLGADIAFLQRQIVLVQGMTESGTVNVKTFILGSDPESSATFLSQKQGLYEVKRVAVAAHDTECGILRDTLARAETTLTEAQRVEATALGALLRVCPTFNPDTVIV